MEEQDEAVRSGAGLTIELTCCFPVASMVLSRYEGKVGSVIEGSIEDSEVLCWSAFLAAIKPNITLNTHFPPVCQAF